jgi:TATA-box binding protein (TBP) (component of TFIID and TFIIIB)
MRITNVVVQGELGCTFDLRELTQRLVNVRFDPRSFSGLIWQHCKIGGNCLLFSNGKKTVTGNVSRCETVEDGFADMQDVYRRWSMRCDYPMSD